MCLTTGVRNLWNFIVECHRGAAHNVWHLPSAGDHKLDFILRAEENEANEVDRIVRRQRAPLTIGQMQFVARTLAMQWSHDGLRAIGHMADTRMNEFIRKRN